MDRMDINQRLDEVLLDNRVIQETSYDKAIFVLRDLEKKLGEGKKIGIYGVGIEAEGLLYFISKHTDRFRIDHCFDKTIRDHRFKDIIQDHDVLPIERSIDLKVDYLLLGSYEYRQTFLENLEAIGYQGKVIDLFSCMKGYIDDHFTDYKKVFKARQAYLNAVHAEKARALQGLIKQYLLLKDFINAFRYIDIYVSSRYPGSGRYEKLKKDIEALLQEIKGYMNERRKKDIMINWIDALSYYDIPEFSFLKQKTEEGICFENAYTVTPWTTETTKTILSGEYPIEGRLFLRNVLSKDNMRVLHILDENGYGFRYCGMPRFAKLFDGSEMAYVHYLENKYCGSMQKQWDALDILCKSETPVCILMHTLRETHEPFICGEGDTLRWFGSTKADWEQEACKKQAEISGRYIDEQLRFYEDFYGKNAVEIYMSDHGRVGNSPMDEKKIHVMLSVNRNDHPHKVIKNMFSLVCFPELIQKIIYDEEDWDSLTTEHVLIENLDAYSELAVRDTLSGRLDREEMYQCRGIVTAVDRYFLYAYGKEYYFKGHTLMEDEIDDPLCKDRISELRHLCGDGFIDIFRYEKFKYARQLYADIDLDIKNPTLRDKTEGKG